jgi:hypothetical protein
LIRLLPNGDTRICVTRSRGGKFIAATHNAKGKHLTLPMTKQFVGAHFSPEHGNTEIQIQIPYFTMLDWG